jgi:hypothetical protein
MDGAVTVTRPWLSPGPTGPHPGTRRGRINREHNEPELAQVGGSPQGNTSRRAEYRGVRVPAGPHQHLRHDQALTEGWPIATGVIEGACRHLIAGRLDIGGASSGLDGAESRPDPPHSDQGQFTLGT